jgi:hypothetical protein
MSSAFGRRERCASVHQGCQAKRGLLHGWEKMTHYQSIATLEAISFSTARPGRRRHSIYPLRSRKPRMALSKLAF